MERRRKAMWLYPKVVGFNPPERWGHSACFFQGVIYVFGGCCGGLHFSDVLTLNLDTMAWSSLATKGQKPGTRDSHGAALIGHRMLVFGGTNGNKKVNDLHVLDLRTKEWSRPPCKGTPPSPRESHTVTKAAGGDKLVVFGGSGEGEGNYLNDVHVLDVPTMTWTSPQVTGEVVPAPRDSHGAVTVGNRLFVYGGDCGDRYHGEVDVLDMDTMAWSRFSVKGASPGVRAGHAALGVGSKIYVIGGVGDKQYYSDAWILDVVDRSWTQLETCGQQPQGRFSHSAVIMNTDIAIYGGCGEDERPLNELLVLQLGSGHPNGRYNISMCKILSNHWSQEKRKLLRAENGARIKVVKKINGVKSYQSISGTTLVLLGTIIAPHSTKTVPRSFYKLVHDVDAIKSFNWNAFTLRVCIDSVTKTVKDLKKFKWPVGNLALLQYMYWEKIQPTDEETTDYLAHEYPLMICWFEVVAAKRDVYDGKYYRGHGKIDDNISEQYRQSIIANEAIGEEEETEAPKQKGSKTECSSSRDTTLDQLMKCMKDMQKQLRQIPTKCAQIVIEQLKKEGLIMKANQELRDEFDCVNESEEWMKKYPPKYFDEVNSTPMKERKKEKIETSRTGAERMEEKEYTTSGKGYEKDPYIIDDNVGSPTTSSESLPTKEFPSMTPNRRNGTAVSGGSSAERSDEVSTEIEPRAKRKRKESKYCRSPYKTEEAANKRVKKSLFGPKGDIFISETISEFHIEAARIYIETLSKSKKFRAQKVVTMLGLGGETSTAEQLEAITSRRWLNGAVINCYCNHMQTSSPRSDRHVLSSWISHYLLQRAAGKVRRERKHEMEEFADKSKTLSRVRDEYFVKDKAYFPFNVDNNHWITVVMHNKKKEFQVLNSTGRISNRVYTKIVTMRTEIAKDAEAVNSLLGADYPDVSCWPIREHDMPLQEDSVSCGLFVMQCVQLWDGDKWMYLFNQDDIHSMRGRVLAEILFSETNTEERVKDKILKIMMKD